jgi:hypothetical protein
MGPVDVNREKTIYGRISAFREKAPILFQTVVFLLLLEMLTVFVAPLVLPENWYLYLFLGEKSRMSTARFERDDHDFLQYDGLVGWRNRPCTKKGNWVTDDAGSRSTTPPSHGGKRKSLRVLFLGSSLVNGGVSMKVQDTLSARVEDQDIEAFNFATMLYSFDQVYLSYMQNRRRFHFDSVVIGLSSDPEGGLDNRYIPFLDRGEINMPFFKPRFALVSGKPVLIEPPPREAYVKIFKDPRWIKALKGSDRYYGDFKEFERFGCSPVSSALWYSWKKMRNLWRQFYRDSSRHSILIALMKDLERQAEQDGTHVIYVILPARGDIEPKGIRRILPDRYGERVKELSGIGFDLLNGREILRESGYPVSSLIQQDGVHFTPLANRVMGAVLQEKIHSVYEGR